MKTETDRMPLPAWESSPPARSLERVARLFCGGVCPGLFLGAVFTDALGSFESGSSPIASPATVLLFAGATAILGALLTGFWREKRPQSGTRGMLILLAALLTGYSLLPGPKSALAVFGVLTGGGLAALPLRSGAWRLLAGGAFALSVLLLKGDPLQAALWQAYCFPLLFAAAILWVRAHWLLRLAMLVLLPVVTVLFAGGMLARQPPISSSQPREVAPALPALLMANSDSTRILFLSQRGSLIPGIWLEMPFVSRIESIWPQGVALGRFENPKFKPHAGSTGQVLPKLEPGFQLIYADQLPRGGEAARRGLVRKLWNLLAQGGVLVLPSENRLLLPDSARWTPLPGSDGKRVAASRNALTTDLEQLDARLQKLLAPFGSEPLIPAGIFSALYGTSGKSPQLPPPVDLPSTAGESRPPWVGVGFLFAFLGYGALRVHFSRFGRNSHGFNLVENAAGFVLILLAALDQIAAGELVTGIPATPIWGCLGVGVIALPLRVRATKYLALAALLLPVTWLALKSAVPPEPFWFAVAGIAALASGSVQEQIASEAGFPRNWSTAFALSGWVAGSALYAFLLLLPGEPLLPAILIAATLRLAWPLRF